MARCIPFVGSESGEPGFWEGEVTTRRRLTGKTSVIAADGNGAGGAPARGGRPEPKRRSAHSGVGVVPSSSFASSKDLPVRPTFASFTSGGRSTSRKRGRGSKLPVVSVLNKQSGVKGITWNRNKAGWVVRWNEKKDRALKTKTFSISKYTNAALGKDDSPSSVALQDAVNFRNELARTGRIQDSHVSEHVSSIRGVYWHKGRGCWQVQITIEGKRHTGLFKPKDSSPKAVQRAWREAVASRRELELRHFNIQVADAPETDFTVERKSGVDGVTWHKYAGQWFAAMTIHGKQCRKGFRPRDFSAKEIERARLLAVKCRRQMEKECWG